MQYEMNLMVKPRNS